VHLATSAIDDLKAELAAKRLLLYGVAEERAEQAAIENQFDLEQEELPFLTEILRHDSLTRFEVQAGFPDAVLSRLSRVEGVIDEKRNVLGRLEKGADGFPPTHTLSDEVRMKIAEMEAERESLLASAESLVGDIKSLRDRVQANEAQLVALRRKIEILENQAAGHRRQVQQADMLIGGMQEGQRFADVQGGTAVKPDKRVFPKRTLMTAVGMLVSFVLFCCFAFFLEIWPRITSDTP
jgi:chromosome segregation ATPase